MHVAFYRKYVICWNDIWINSDLWFHHKPYSLSWCPPVQNSTKKVLLRVIIWQIVLKHLKFNDVQFVLHEDTLMKLLLQGCLDRINSLTSEDWFIEIPAFETPYRLKNFQGFPFLFNLNLKSYRDEITKYVLCHLSDRGHI